MGKTEAPTPPAPNLLSELLSAYKQKHLRNGAEGTLRQYEVTLRNVAKFLKRPATLDDLSDDLVQDLMAWFVERGRTPRGSNKIRSNLHTLWSFACRNGWLSRWPDSKAMVLPKRIVVAWTPEQLRLLHQVLSGQKGAIVGVPANLWWVALHSVMWDSGERIGAVVELAWDHVALDRGLVTFKAETRKNGREDNQAKLHPETVELLARVKAAGHHLVFRWPGNQNYLWIKYREIRRKAGLPTDRAHSFHCMRKSSASYFEASGGNATELLKHSSRDVTTRFYLDRSITEPNRPTPADVLPRMAEAVVPEKTDLSRWKALKASEMVEEVDEPQADHRTDDEEPDAPPMPSQARLIRKEQAKSRKDELVAKNRIMTSVDVGGVPHRISVGQAAVLEILRCRPEGVERHELFELLRKTGYRAKASVFDLIRRLRTWLKVAYACPAGWDPLVEEFAGEEVSKEALCPRRLKTLKIRLPERTAATGHMDGLTGEWDILHDMTEGRVRRSSQVLLNGAVHQIAFSDAMILELVRGGQSICLSEIELRFKILGYGPTTVLSSVRDARRFLRRVFELPDSHDPLPVTGSPKGPGAVGRGDVRLNLPTDIG